MCAVSVIYDMFSKLPDTWYTKERIDLFKDMVLTATIFDIETNQSDCADPEKEKLEEHIQELEKQLEEKNNG